MTDTSRSLGEIEQDIVKINETLATISEVRSALKDFTSLVLQETKGPNYVHSFGDRLNHVKRGLNRLAAESEVLKGGLSYAQVAANKTYHWPTIKNAVENNAAAEERRQAENNAGRPKDPCLVIKKNTDQALKQLSHVVLEKKSLSTTPNYITTQINEWLAHEKPNHVELSVHFNKPECDTVSGSSCSFTVTVLKALTATLEVDYYRASDTITFHRYEVNSSTNRHPHQEQPLVFQKLNVLADMAFQDMSVLPAREAISSILHWIASYYNLFTEPCFRCHRRLQFDSPHYKYLPPMVRTWIRRKVDYMEPDREMPQAYTTAGIAYHMLCFVAATKVASKVAQ